MGSQPCCTSGRDAQTAAPEDSGGRAIFEAADDSVDIDCEDGAEPGSEWRVTLTKAGTPAGLGIETGNGQFVVNLVKPHGRTAEHNGAHPSAAIRTGDVIASVNDVSDPVDLLEQLKTAEVLDMVLRRPVVTRWIAEVSKETDSLFGFTLKAFTSSIFGGYAVVIDNSGSGVHEYNLLYPENAISNGDRIVAVDGQDAADGDRLIELMKAFNGTCKLTVERRS